MVNGGQNIVNKEYCLNKASMNSGWLFRKIIISSLWNVGNYETQKTQGQFQIEYKLTFSYLQCITRWLLSTKLVGHSGEQSVLWIHRLGTKKYNIQIDMACSIMMSS